MMVKFNFLKVLTLIFTLVQLVSFEANASWILKRIVKDKVVTPIGAAEVSKEILDGETLNLKLPKTIKNFPLFLGEHQPASSENYQEIFWPYDQLPSEYIALKNSSSRSLVAGSEMRTIVEQGPAKNRICLTFTGDGYTESEKEKFFADVARLVDDLFDGKTFQSYTPLFNVYAVFVPSKESGITDIQKKNTAFGLYRSPAGSKRAIMPGNTMAIERAIDLAPKTDYPIIIANDDFYGGLGGRYAITSRSIESGKIVLRHELGHNFGSVGEEYDDGQVYTGANNSRSMNVPWQQWLQPSQQKIVNDMRYLSGAYVWQNLSTSSVVQNFDFPKPIDGRPFWFEVQVSSVGWESLDDVEILLDGKKLVLEGLGTSDRSFFNTKRVNDLAPGKHTLEIKEVKHDGNNILAFASLYAYESDYDFEGVGAFKTYDENKRVSYRPTHDNCIMRDMLYEFFCPVDQENMWFQFFNRVRIIDQVEVTDSKVSIKALELPLSVKWFKVTSQGEVEISELAGLAEVEKNKFSVGEYTVKVQMQNLEVRKNLSQLKDSMKFKIQ